MRKLCALLVACIILAALFPLLKMLAAGNSVYLSQAGGGAGTSCGSALAASYFNSSANWSNAPTGTKIGPGTTVFLCGASITTNLTFQGSGAAGNPVVLDGSNLTAMSAFIDPNSSYWTIQNITWSTSYATNSSTQAVIQTVGGAAFGTIQNNHIDVINSAQLVFFHGTTHDINILNNYLRITTTPGDGFDTDGIDTEGAYNVLIQGNYIAMNIGAGDKTCGGCHDDITQVWGSKGSTYNWRYLNNEFVQESAATVTNNLSWCIFEQISQQNAGYWDLIGNVFVYLSGGSSGNGCVFDGNFSGMTAHIYNNTLYAAAGSGNNLFNLSGSGSYTLENNIVYSTTQGNACTGGVCTSATRLHNLWYGPPSPSCVATEVCGTNPNFVSIPSLNFALQTGSAAIGLGANLGGAPYNVGLLPGATWPNPSVANWPSVGAWNAGAFTTGGAGGSITLSPASNNFGSIIVGSTSGAQTFTLTNNTGSTVTGITPTSTGTNPADFTVTNSGAGSCSSGSLANGSSCAMTVTFSPSATGSRSATLSVADSAAGSPQTSALSGTGTQPSVSFTPTSLAFGNQTTGVASAALSTVLKNTGTATLAISGITVTGTNSADFAENDNCGTGLAVNQSCTINVVFTPGANGSRSASVSVADNAPASPQTVGLSGTGVAATAVVSFTPTSLAFGSQAVLTTSAQQNVTVFNSGSGTLNISGITLTGTNPSDFAIVAPTGINARADQVAQPYNAGAGTVPCPGSNGCSAVILASISVTGTAGTGTFQHTFGSCPFGAATTTQVNGNTLLAENKLHTIATCNGTTFTYNDGVATGTGTDGVASSTGGALVGAGTVIPSDFPNVSLVRVTDSSMKCGSTPGKNGWATTTTGSSETVQFDVGNHMFVAQIQGNVTCAFAFNPGTMATSQMYGGAQVDPNGAHEPTASRVTPYLYYNAELFGGDLSIVSYNFSGAVNPTGTQVVDLKTACGAALPSGLVASNDEPSVNSNDTIFSAIGQTTPGQNNTLIYEIVYNTSTSTCYVWNRGGTGHWFLNGSDQGTVTIHNTSSGTTYTSDTDLQSIHQMRSNYPGQLAGQTTEACLSGVNCTDGLTYWAVGTSNAYFSAEVFSPDTGAGNHTTTGNSDVFFMRANCPTFCDAIYSAPLTNPFGSTLLNYVPGDTVGGDAHPSGANIVNDTQPVCMSHTFDGVGQFQTFLVPYAWNNEFHCQETVPPYRGFRLTHNYASATVSAIFNSAAGVSTVSQDGRFFLTTTDFGCLLGATDGVTAKANCTNNGTVNGRPDIFVGNIPNAVACGATLAPGATCEVGVTFRPTASGSRSANLTFTNNASGSPQNVPLTGTGTSSAAVSLSPSSLTFGPQALTTTSPSQQVNLYNVGGTTLSISGVTLIGTNPGDFHQSNNCGSSVLVGGSCSFLVTFTPSANGARSASIQITDSAAGSPQTVPLSGTGFTATPALSIVPSSLIFATQTVGTPSNAQAIIVTNTGTATVTFSSISITGTNSGDYGQTNSCGSSLAVGKPCSILVTFMPTAAGTRTANVSIADNVSGSPQNVSLSGTGVVGPLVAPDPAIFAMLRP